MNQVDPAGLNHDIQKKKKKILNKSKRLIVTILEFIVAPSLLSAVSIYLFAKEGILGDEIFDLVAAPGFSSEAFAVIAVPVAVCVLCGVLVTVLLWNDNNRHMRSIAEIIKSNKSTGELQLIPAISFNEDESAMCAGVNELLEQRHAANIALSKVSPELDRLGEECDRLTLNLMSARILPHFVIKSLMEINRLIRDNARRGAPVGENSLKIAKLSSGLAEILEAGSRDARQPVSLAGEISLVRLYLDMVEIITGERIKCKLSVMCSIVEYKIAPNLILPVLENFFELAQREGVPAYTMSVEVNSSASGMRISIIDNGSGFFKSAYQKILREIQSDRYDESDSLSLPGINRRIGLLYGKKYGLKLDTSKLYSSIIIVLPPVNETIGEQSDKFI